MKVEFYEPPMCCPTGLCGPAPDTKLVQLSEDINKLKEKYPGITIERYMITQQPLRFRENAEVYCLVKEKSKDILPITTVNGRVVQTGSYPTFEEIVQGIEGENK